MSLPAPKIPLRSLADFLKSASEFNAGQISEGQTFPPYAESLKSRLASTAAARPPKECQGLAAGDWMDIQDGEFALSNPGTWSRWLRMRRPPTAALPGSLQAITSGPLSTRCLTTWGAWASGTVTSRCDAKPRPTLVSACAVGLYNGPEKKGETTIAVQIPDVADGEYHTIDLGVHELKPGMYFWIAPTGKPNDVTAVYTDRIFLIKKVNG